MPSMEREVEEKTGYRIAVRKTMTNLPIGNYKKNMILATRAIHNAYGCFNYWCKGCWSCTNRRIKSEVEEPVCIKPRR